MVLEPRGIHQIIHSIERIGSRTYSDLSEILIGDESGELPETESRVDRIEEARDHIAAVCRQQVVAVVIGESATERNPKGTNRLAEPESKRVHERAKRTYLVGRGAVSHKQIFGMLNEIPVLTTNASPVETLQVMPFTI